MKLTERMQQVIAIGNELATTVSYTENMVCMTFECRCLTSRKTSAAIQVAVLRVDTHKRECVLTLDEITESIHWFSNALMEYHTALGEVVQVYARLLGLGYTKQ